MINSVALTGRLTKDPEVRRTQNDKAVSSFTIAVDRDYKNQDGSRTADFVNCVAWGKSAELLHSYAHRGDMLGIEGRIQTRNYQDKNGNRVFVTEVLVGKLSFLGGGKSGNNSNTSHSHTQDPFPKNSNNVQVNPNDLPF